MKDHAAQTNNKDAELVQLKIAVRSLLDDVNKRYPDKNPREWTCKHMQLLDDLIEKDVVQEKLPTIDENSVDEKETIRVSFAFDVEGEPMYKTISDLGKKSGWNARVFQWEDSDEVRGMLQNPQDHSKWYYVDFYMTNDYTNGTRIEGTKEDLQRIVDMLNVAINGSKL